ncbi:MAG: hypothetical protein ACTHK1_07960 [Actinomycetales bacterium]
MSIGNDWDEGFLQDSELADLRADRFLYRGQLFHAVELHDADRELVLRDAFANWP